MLYFFYRAHLLARFVRMLEESTRGDLRAMWYAANGQFSSYFHQVNKLMQERVSLVYLKL